MKRSPKQVRASNRNWALGDVRGFRTKVHGMRCNDLIDNALEAEVLAVLDTLERRILIVKP